MLTEYSACFVIREELTLRRTVGRRESTQVYLPHFEGSLFIRGWQWIHGTVTVTCKVRLTTPLTLHLFASGQ